MRKQPWTLEDWVFFRRILRLDPVWLTVLEPLPPLSNLALHLMTAFRCDQFETSFLRRFVVGFAQGNGPYRSIFFQTPRSEWSECLGRCTHRVRTMDELAALLTAGESDRLSQPFPPPPVSGYERIIPLAEPTQLREVSAAMRHCAWRMYRESVCAGHMYFFLQGNTQSGLTLRMWRCIREWRVVEARGLNNRLPTGIELMEIEAWARTRGVRVEIPVTAGGNAAE